jgi:cellulose synthase/poly-beta-1,6-N-acetylglucosamine synthase-like glycosyltransferase
MLAALFVVATVLLAVPVVVFTLQIVAARVIAAAPATAPTVLDIPTPRHRRLAKRKVSRSEPAKSEPPKSERTGSEPVAPGPEPALPARDARAPLAVLVPAHNEANGIAATLVAIRAQLGGEDKLLVVADNCSDDTAAIARRHGAEVTERHHPELRGKSYALAHGSALLAQAPPAVVIVIDADCLLADGALSHLVRVVMSTKRPAQAAYLMRASPAASPARTVAEFAWAVKNCLRPLGWSRLGFGCQLTGSGMAFPWTVWRDAPLASGHLVEDLKLGLDLAQAGKAPVFCPQAVVTSVFADNAVGEQSQRTRWEHGHLGLMLAYGPRLLSTAIRRRQWPLLALVLDLCVPPVSLLLMLAVAWGTIGAAAWRWTGDAAPWSLALAPALVLNSALILAWRKIGRQILPARRLAHALLYLAAKLPLYLRFVGRRQVTWIASTRDKH